MTIPAAFKPVHDLLDDGQVREAAELCRQRLDADRKSAYGHYLMSVLFAQAGNLERAKEFAARAVEYEAANPDFIHHYGKIQQQMGNLAGAEDSYRRVMLMSRQHQHVLADLFNVLTAQQKYKDAQGVLRRMIEIQPDNPVFHHMHAALSGDTTAYAPHEFVVSLFDQAAPGYDNHMVNALSYRTPVLFAERIHALPQVQSRLLQHLLDLGCGTGLAAEKLREVTFRRIGVDLSQQMLQKARAKNLYDELVRSDVVEYMQNCAQTFELVIAADVLVYIGDLVPFMAAARPVLAPGGALVLSVEKELREEPYRLNQTGRYSHRPDYVAELARAEGFTILAQDEVVLRIEDGRVVQGIIFVLALPV